MEDVQQPVGADDGIGSEEPHRPQVGAKGDSRKISFMSLSVFPSHE